MDYLLMQPPFEVKTFKNMSKKEAETHFNWYVNEIPSRLELLEKTYRETSNEVEIVLDYSPESLIKLWQWYINNVEIEEKSEELKKLEMEQYPEWVRVNLSSQKISIGWMAIAMDIAIYFSEFFIREHTTIKWGIVSKPKSLAYINKPVLVGFKGGLDLDSTNLVRVLTSKLIDGDKDANSLLKVYTTWSGKV